MHAFSEMPAEFIAWRQWEWVVSDLTAELWSHTVYTQNAVALTLCDISVSTIQSGILKSPVASRSLAVEQSMKLCLISANVHLNGHSSLVVTMPAGPEWEEKPAVSKSAGANNLLRGLRWSRVWVSLGNWAKQGWKCFPGLHSSVSQCLTSSPRGSGRPRSIQTAFLV